MPTIRPQAGKHSVVEADSSQVDYVEGFDLILTCPPYFHPSKKATAHGQPSPCADVCAYADWVAQVLWRAARALKPGKPLCVVKTDVKYRGRVLPVGFHIADCCERMGLPVRAHWIWQRLPHYSPYAPSIANIFVLGDCSARLLHHGGVFRTHDARRRSQPSSFTPDLFEAIMCQLSDVGDIVLDPFAGAGSIAVAAARSGRWSAGIDVCTSQIQKFTRVLGAMERPHIALSHRNDGTRS